MPSTLSGSSEVILRTVDLRKQFGSRLAVRDLNLDVHRGEIFGFLGPNGAGKSTTIRMILSLIRPSGGYVEIFGRRLEDHRSAILRKVGGLVESADFYLYLSARRNLEIVASLYGGLEKHTVDHALELVGLTERSDDRVKTFSHGMKQRLGIAQALLSNPELIILDEPTTGLDPQGIVEVRELILSLARDRGITVFLSSHLLSEIEQTASNMAIISRGKLAVQGPVRSLLATTEMVLTVEATPLDAAGKILSEFRSVRELKQLSGRFEMTIDANEVPSLTKLFVERGLEVRALIPRRSLEEYFLNITEEASVDAKGK